MSSPDPENTLTSADVEHLNTLESIVQRYLDADLDVRQALAEIDDARLYRDTHQTFEAYLRDRWGFSGSRAHALIHPAEPAGDRSAHTETSARPTEAEARVREAVRQEGAEALAKLWERARHEFGGDDVTAVDVHLTVRRRSQPAELAPEPWLNPWQPAGADAGELLWRLRWLLTQSCGTIADAAHQFEARAAELDDRAREQLRDDLLSLDEELATLKALFLAPVDWDAEYERLLAGELPPFDDEADDGTYE